jgi:hypothetical protein
VVRKEELKYIKEIYEEPDGYLHYTKFSEYVDIDNFGIIPDIDHWDEIQYCTRPTHTEGQFDGIGRGVTVCQCVWEMTGKNTHGALVYYLREVIKAGGVMPVDVKIEDGKVTYLDGSHRVLANIHLKNDMIPVYINREKHHWVTCWRPGMILEDGTLDMSYDFSDEGILV